ncbi:MAG TPA: DNA gyrase inhibitor YacG [Alphaproteobacteria bacterium]|nr:DNA gyrase inhibitor YacG [Alphaproteobacteria bacterium]
MGQAIVKKCPVCGKIPAEKFEPFCSKRCADIDLGGWLGERYRVQTNEGPEAADNGDSDIE